MELAFKTEISGWITRFMEKIIRGAFWSEPLSTEVAAAIHHPKFDNTGLEHLKPKHHSIRADEKDRWKVGMNIHFVINNRTKNRFQFAPILKVISLQKFELKYTIEKTKTTAQVYIDDVLQGEAVWVNCQLRNSSATIDQLAQNDGFDSTDGFFEWFDQDFTGKIIHWTNLRY